MLLVDDRIGSVDLARPLADAGMPVTVARLEYADVAFEGKGNDDVPVMIGVELKKLGDLVSSLRSGRLSGHQLPGLAGPHAVYNYAWLLIEGQWRSDPKGELLVQGHFGKWQPLPGHMTVSELEKRVLTLEMLGGLRVRHTPNRAATLHFITNLYRWWTDVAMDRHTTHLIEHTAQSFLPLSAFRRTVKCFPGIGTKASLAAEKYFGGSLARACNASEAEWAALSTLDKRGHPKRLGAKVAHAIVAFCQGTS